MLPQGLDAPAARRRAKEENFPVALALLGRQRRADLLALYGYARFIDDLGDEDLEQYPDAGRGTEARLALLHAARRELAAASTGSATHAVFAALAPLLQAGRLKEETLSRLIEANIADQKEVRYESFSDLLQYCSLSANPVGEAVLGIFGRDEEDLVRLSDSICSALQVIEHLQDLGEDAGRQRFYIPSSDLFRFGATLDDLSAPSASPALRRTVVLQAKRARSMLGAAPELASRLGGLPGLAVAAFAAGGHAALDEIEAHRFDTLSIQPKVRPLRLISHLVGIWRSASKMRRRLPPQWLASSAHAPDAPGRLASCDRVPRW